MRIFITGAAGFVGAALARQCSAAACTLLTRDRSKIPDDLRQYSWKVGELASLAPADFQGIDVVIHAAAKAHDPGAPASDYVMHNEQATAHLLACAKEAGVRRFVFISTIKVNGESTEPGRPFRADDAPQAADPYALSKLACERRVQASGMEWVIVRPPLVYGPGVKGNLRSLQKLIAKGIPLPLGAIRNRRSLVALENLVDAVWKMATVPHAAGNIFLISDGKPVSTPELIAALARASGRKILLLPMPMSVLKIICMLLGKKELFARLCGSLEVDDTPLRALLGWNPPVNFTTAIARL